MKLTVNCWSVQRLAGATLLVFANKQDLAGAVSPQDIRKVRLADGGSEALSVHYTTCHVIISYYLY